MGDSLMKCFVIAVIKTANRRRHANIKDVIDALKHCTAGAEIGRQHDLSSLVADSIFGVGIACIFMQENAGISQAELVNGLLYVANHETILPFLRQRSKNRILNSIGILVLIHHNLTKTAANLRCRICSAGTAFADKQVKHTMLKVAKIHNTALLFQTVVFHLKGAYQLHQTPYGSCTAG